MQRGAAGRNEIEQLVAGMERALRRLAREIVVGIFEEEAARRTARVADTMAQAFEAALQQFASAADDDGLELTGIVKWFNDSKGFGFIRNAAGEDVFVHYKHIVAPGFRELNEGDTVVYREHVGERGRFATHVRRA